MTYAEPVSRGTCLWATRRSTTCTNTVRWNWICATSGFYFLPARRTQYPAVAPRRAKRFSELARPARSRARRKNPARVHLTNCCGSGRHKQRHLWRALPPHPRYQTAHAHTYVSLFTMFWHWFIPDRDPWHFGNRLSPYGLRLYCFVCVCVCVRKCAPFL